MAYSENAKGVIEEATGCCLPANRVKMTVISRCVQAFKRFDRAVLPGTVPVRVSNEMAAALRAKPLVIADVGAAGGLDPRWDSLRNYAQFLTFEPRPDESIDASRVKNFPIGLGATKGKKVLYLTRFPQSSSVYPMDQMRMHDFAVRDCFTVVKSMPVEISTLDDCLATPACRLPQFLKVDVEGGELDVLKGAQQTLETSLLGLRVEVSFLARQVGVPLFGEVDGFLRERGFELFALSRELMVRHNLTHCPLSQPQLVWGDAVYFLTRERFLKRLEMLSLESRPAVLTQFVLILLSHGVHDFTVEVLDATQAAGLVGAGVIDDLKRGVTASVRRAPGYLVRALAGTCLGLAIYALAIPSKEARKHASFYLKRRAGYLFHYLWRMTARGGECNASVSDLLT